jgi:hypothetical protein
VLLILSSLSHNLCLLILVRRRSTVYLKKVSFKSLIYQLFLKAPKSLIPALLTKSRTKAQTKLLRSQDSLFKHITIRRRNLYWLSHQQSNNRASVWY